MDRSRHLSWSLGIGLLSTVVGGFVLGLTLPFFALFFPSMSVGELVVLGYCVMIGIFFPSFALIFRSSLVGASVTKTSGVAMMRHPIAGRVLFVVGLGYGLFVLATTFSIYNFFPPLLGGVGWSYSIITALLYPLSWASLALKNSPWPVLLVPLYLALPDIAISYLLFHWRARVLAPVLAVLTAIGVLAFGWFFLLLAAF